jgi:protein phosphatase
MSVEAAGKTHPGYREGANEDAIGWSNEAGLWLVADGMGGHASGQLASEIARDVVLQGDPDTELKTLIVQAHDEIRRRAAEVAERKGMGTTIVAARRHGNVLEIAWVGDSRAYLLRDGKLKQISVDHSFVEMLRAHVEMSDDEVRNHPQKNILTQTLGHDLPAPSDMQLPLRNGDRILLCSDGLTDEVPDAEIESIMRRQEALGEICHALLQRALDNGGRDNVSAVVIDYHGESHPEVTADTTAETGTAKAVLAGIAAAMGVVLLMAWFMGRLS